MKNSSPDYNGVQNLETKIQTPIHNCKSQWRILNVELVGLPVILSLATSLSNHFQKIEK